MLHRFCFAVLLALFVFPLFAHSSESFSPAYVEIAQGETVRIWACGVSAGFSSPPIYWVPLLVNRTPDVVTMVRIESADCSGGYDVTGIMPGLAILSNPRNTQDVTILVTSCADLPLVGERRRFIKAAPGQLVEMRPNPVTSTPIALFAWYEGPLGDRTHPLNWFGPFRIFTPAEAKQYRFWVEISERCGTKSIEYVVDATEVMRRRAVRR